jgi:hypothetical protein
VKTKCAFAFQKNNYLIILNLVGFTYYGVCQVNAIVPGRVPMRNMGDLSVVRPNISKQVAKWPVQSTLHYVMVFMDLH